MRMHRLRRREWRGGKRVSQRASLRARCGFESRLRRCICRVMAESVEAITRIRDGGSTIVVDTQHWPVVFATWFGDPTEAAVTRYFEVHDTLFVRARKERKPFVLVTDAAHAHRPSPKVRKLIADKTNAQPSDAAELTLGSIIVVENTLIRGVVTALTWILPRLKDSQTVGSIEDAVDVALRMLDDRRLVRPLSLSAAGYRRPAA